MNDPTEAKFVVECIQIATDEMMGRLPIRKIVGPFPTFDEAYNFMMDPVTAKRFETCLIHTLTEYGACDA